jgi:hypothetical protein
MILGFWKPSLSIETIKAPCFETTLLHSSATVTARGFAQFKHAIFFCSQKETLLYLRNHDISVWNCL